MLTAPENGRSLTMIMELTNSQKACHQSDQNSVHNACATKLKEFSKGQR
jgi:hypothetical protein